MKTTLSILFSLLMLANSHVFAHSDHGHSDNLISDAHAMSIAAAVTKQLSVRDAGLVVGKLPASWGLVAKDAYVMHKKGNGYYIVAAENSVEKKTLYVLMSPSGKVYDVNFEGKFEGIE
ncbi:MAG: hypothetical protein ACI93R_001152 [Flavobacteriales bacterium]|jgi:hypothetical protein